MFFTSPPQFTSCQLTLDILPLLLLLVLAVKLRYHSVEKMSPKTRRTRPIRSHGRILSCDIAIYRLMLLVSIHDNEREWTFEITLQDYEQNFFWVD